MNGVAQTPKSKDVARGSSERTTSFAGAQPINSGRRLAREARVRQAASKIPRESGRELSEISAYAQYVITRLLRLLISSNIVLP